MNHPAHVKLVQRLLAQAGGAPAAGVFVKDVAASVYTSDERLAREKSALFDRLPHVVGHSSEVAEAGACLTVDVGGVSLLLVRGEDGALRAFKNACRHRSTRLVWGDEPCRKKAFVCPYHGWTYDLRGSLIHAPHAASFRGQEASRTELAPAYVGEKEGLVWVALAPFDVDAFLSPIAGELASFGSQTWRLYKRSVREVRGNWKLIVDAFLDGYHIRHLHRDSIYRFFIDALYDAERAGDHIRAVTARRALTDARADAIATTDLRQLVTPSYFLFPSTIVIVHPDYASVLSATPLTANRSRFVHQMLIPHERKTLAEERHWAKSFALIDDGVFAREDLAVVEAIQAGLQTGANETLLCGELEHAISWFHESIERSLTAAS